MTTLVQLKSDKNMPDWSSFFTDPADFASANEHWKRVIEEMTTAETLSAINQHQIRRYVVAMVEYEIQFAQMNEEGGPILTNKTTGMPFHNPRWAVVKDFAAQATDCEEKLGLNPRRRDQVSKVQKAAKAETPAQKFLKTA